MDIGLCIAPPEAANLSNGFDFIEANVQNFLVPENPEEDFTRNLDAARAAHQPVKAANCFLPASLKCVGPQIDHERLLRYAENAFRRAEIAGIGIIVFGSGGSRNVPEGHSKEHAMTEFVGLLRLLGPIAQHHNLTVVVEPLHAGECNFINTLADGAEAVTRCNHPHVRLLADTFHMWKGSESMIEVSRFASLIVHAHVAELQDRAFPGKSGEDFRPFLRALQEGGYSGRIAMECGWGTIADELPRSIAYFRQQLAESGF